MSNKQSGGECGNGDYEHIPENWEMDRERAVIVHKRLVSAFEDVNVKDNAEMLYEIDQKTDLDVIAAHMKIEEALSLLEGDRDPRRGGLDDDRLQE